MKKWSYAAAMLLIASSGCVFTGCIDNDEPYGIEQVRLATANLLEAKKEAVAAQAAAANAQVEIAKIQAEIDKLNAENQKILNEAEAKVKEAEAQAKLLQAQADAAKTQAEADKFAAEAAIYQAQADQIKAATEAYVKDQEAGLNEKIALAAINVQQAQLKYDKALYAFEQRKITEAEGANDELWKAVEAAFGSYLWNLDAYNQANQTYLEGLRKLAELNLDLVWIKDAQNEWHFVSPAYNQEASLKKVKANIETSITAKNQDIDLYQSVVDALDGISGSELYGLLEKYQADYEAAVVEYEKANAAYQLVWSDPANQDILNAPAKIQEEIDALETQEMPIPGWEYEPIPQLHVLGNGWDKAHVVVEDGQSFTYESAIAEPGNPMTAYEKAVKTYKDAIQEIKGVSFDDNDQVWSDARIKELKRSIPILAEQVTRSWSMAKAVYSNGDKVTAEAAAKAPNGDNVAKTAKAYNESLPGLAAARDAKQAAEKEVLKAREAYTDADQNAWDDAKGDWENAKTAWAAVDVAGADKDSQAYKDAKALYEQAEKDYKAAETKYKANADKYEAALTDLKGVWSEEEMKFVGGKANAYIDALNDSKDALEAFETAIQTQIDQISQYKPTAGDWAGKEFAFAPNPNLGVSDRLDDYAEDTKNNVKAPEVVIPFTLETNGIYVNAKNYIIYASDYTFGWLPGVDNINGGNDWDKDLAILLPIDFANPIPNTTKILGIFNGYLEAAGIADSPWAYKDKYTWYFGKYATVLKDLYSLQIGEAYLNNDLNAALQEVLKTPEANLAALEKSYNDQKDAIQAKETEKTQAQDASTALTKEANDKCYLAGEYKNKLAEVVTSLKSAVNEYADDLAHSIDPDSNNFNSLDKLKTYYAQQLDAAKTSLTGLEDQLAEIEYKISKYEGEDGYASLENPYQYEVDYLLSQVENAKSLMEFSKARYEELQAKYDAAVKK